MTSEPTGESRSGAAEEPGRWEWRDWVDWECVRTKLPEPLDTIDWATERSRIGLVDAQGVSDTEADRRHWLARWRDRRMEGAHPEAGAVFQGVVKGAGFLAGVAGLLSGWGVATAALTPSGTLPDGSPEPVNVLRYLLVCVVPPLILALLAFVWILFAPGRGVRPPAVLRWLSGWFAGLMESLWSRVALRSRGPEQDLRVQGSVHIQFRKALRLRPAVWQWPAALAFQWFGLLFTVAVFLCTFTTITVSDRSFGWQTSWSDSGPEGISRFTRIVSAPWAPLTGAGARPTDEEIRLSQVRPMSRQEYDDRALKSWWPFLMWCDGVYGILPRALLLGLTYGLSRRALRRERLDDPGSDRIWRLLARPVMRTQIREERNPALERRGPEVVDGRKGDRTTGRDAVLLVTRKGGPDGEQWESLIQREFGWTPAGRALEWSEVTALLAKERGRALVVVEASYMAPVRALQLAVAKVRAEAGSDRRVVIALFGRNGAPTEQEMNVWREKTADWSDPWLEVIAFPGV